MDTILLHKASLQLRHVLLPTANVVFRQNRGLVIDTDNVTLTSVSIGNGRSTADLHTRASTLQTSRLS